MQRVEYKLYLTVSSFHGILHKFFYYKIMKIFERFKFIKPTKKRNSNSISVKISECWGIINKCRKNFA